MLTAEYDETNRGDDCEPQKPVYQHVVLTTDTMNNWSTYQIFDAYCDRWLIDEEYCKNMPFLFHCHNAATHRLNRI